MSEHCAGPDADMVADDLLYAETALGACGIVVDEIYNRECWPLLRIIRRKMKMNTAFIANQNANRIIFKDSKGPGIQSFKVCGDLLEDRGVREGIAGLLQHGVRAYLGVSMILEGGKVATLIVASNQPRTFSPEDISVAGEICACIEDRYRMRRETAITNTVSNLTISSVLLSSIKVYLHTATTCMEAMDQIYIDITCPPMTAEEPSYASLPPTEGALSINQLSLGEGTSAVSMSRNASDAASLSKDAPAAPSNATPTPRSSFFKINQARDRGSTASLGVEALASSLQLPKSISATPNSSTPEPSIYHHAQNRTSTTVVVTKERQDSQWRKMQSLALRFEMLQGQIQDAIERALMVAQHYTSKNKNKYYISCFHAEASGFVEGMNTVLQGLTKLIPDHSLMWSYNINSSLAHCGHRTFYSHLVFFLEGLVFRWANHCSSAQINISFESHGTIDYYDPQANNIRSIYHKASDTNALGAAVHSIMNTAMLNNTLNAYHNYIHNVQADEATPVYDPNLINWNDSKNDKALSKGPDPMTASKSSITAFNVDEYVFNYDDVGSTATDSVGADVAQLEAMNSSIDIGAIIDRAKDSSSESDRLDTARTRNPSFQAESDSRSLHCTTDDVGSGSLDANSGIDGSGDGTDSIYGAGRMKLNLKIDTDVEPVNKDKGHIQYGYLRILFQPLDLVMDEEGGISSKNESSLPQSIGGFATNISPLLNTAELMRVLGDFLYEIDTKAVVSLAPKHFMRTLPEPNSIAFMIVLPCYFKITEKERAPSTAKESAVIAGGSCINMSSLGLAPSSTELANNTNRKMSRAKRIVRNSSKKNGRMSTVDEADEDDEQLKCLSSSGSQSFITRRRGAPASDWRSESGKSNKSGSSKMRRKRSQGQMHKSGSKTSDGLNSSESKSMLQTIAFTVPPQLTPSQVMKSTESLARSVTKSLVSFRTSIRGQGSADELNGSTAIVPSGKPSSNADLLQGTHPSSISSVASNHVVHPSRSVITSLLSSFNFSSLYHSMFRSNSVQPT